jgi:diadenosine tetraphosphatase ApaH/serine/threonine PP2A family protein phosphatase
MGFIDLWAFNDEARRALEVQMRLLSEESRQFLELLKPKDVQDGVTLAHGSPRDSIWEYVMSAKVAERNFSAFETQVCLIGHSHIPVIFVDNGRRSLQVLMPSSGDMWRSKQRFLLNPGSVGQPRDRDPRAAYVLWDSEEDIWTYHRVNYDVAPVQEKILALGIPSIHAMRLAYGM